MDHVEIATGGKVRSLAANDDHAHGIVDVDGTPHQGEITVHGLGRRIQSALVRHDQFEYSGLRRKELQAGKFPRITGKVDRRRHGTRLVHEALPGESGTA